MEMRVSQPGPNWFKQVSVRGLHEYKPRRSTTCRSTCVQELSISWPVKLLTLQIQVHERSCVLSGFKRFVLYPCSPWYDFKLLIDLVIRENTTAEADLAVTQDPALLCKIRHLVLDFHVFAAAPRTIWTHFPDLETLTIVFYPSIHIEDINGDENWAAYRPTFSIPKPNTNFG